MRSILSLLASILPILTKCTPTKEERLEVLYKAYERPEISDRELWIALPNIPPSHVATVTKEIRTMTRVPVWIHNKLVEYVNKGGQRLDDPALVWMVSSAVGETHAPMIVKYWLIFCVNPSRRWPNICKQNKDWWELTPQQHHNMILGLIYELSNTKPETVANQEIEAVITAAFKKNPSVSAELASRVYNVDLVIVRGIRDRLMCIFKQPVWFLEELRRNFQDPAPAIDLRVSREQNRICGEVKEAITIWRHLLLANPGVEDTQLFIQNTGDANFVMFRGTYIKQYFESLK